MKDYFEADRSHLKEEQIRPGCVVTYDDGAHLVLDTVYDDLSDEPGMEALLLDGDGSGAL